LHGVFQRTGGGLGFEVGGHERDFRSAGLDLTAREFERGNIACIDHFLRGIGCGIRFLGELRGGGGLGTRGLVRGERDVELTLDGRLLGEETFFRRGPPCLACAMGPRFRFKGSCTFRPSCQRFWPELKS
jgi:hypothetical protein